VPGHSYDRGSGDRGRIRIAEERECRYWAARLGVHPRELRAAVDAVGNRVDDVWRYVDELKHEEPHE
jgi:hypothetical protein